MQTKKRFLKSLVAVVLIEISNKKLIFQLLYMMKFRKILRVIKNKIKINCLMSKMRVNKNRKKREILL